jgi:CopG family transcriptional regulator, nickel-responsive regulator
MSSRLIRFGVSIDEPLLARFDDLIVRSGHANRSEAVRDLIRARLVEDETADDTAHAFGVLSIVYDHHQRDLQERLVSIQHDHTEHIISTTHVHIDHHNCLEVILLRGPVGVIRRMSDALALLKGVKHSRLALTGSGDAAAESG